MPGLRLSAPGSVAVWMAGMKFRPAAALVAVVWYLMRPPMPHLKIDHRHRDTGGPLTNWVIVERFPSKKECEARLRDSRWDLCVASDDPRLNDNSINRNHFPR